MAGPPNEVLSQHVRKMLSGRRVTAAVFMTFTLEPEFFESEIVPLLAGDHLIQEPRMRLLQLEENGPCYVEAAECTADCDRQPAECPTWA